MSRRRLRRREPLPLSTPSTPREQLRPPVDDVSSWTPWSTSFADLDPFLPQIEVPTSWQRPVPPTAELPERLATAEEWAQWLLAAAWPARIASLLSARASLVPEAYPLLWWHATGERPDDTVATDAPRPFVRPGHRWTAEDLTRPVGTILTPHSLTERLASSRAMRTFDWISTLKDLPDWPPDAWLAVMSQLPPQWWASALNVLRPVLQQSDPTSAASAALFLSLCVHRARCSDLLEDSHGVLETWVYHLCNRAPRTPAWERWRHDLANTLLGDAPTTTPPDEQAYWAYHHYMAGALGTMALVVPPDPAQPHALRLQRWWHSRLADPSLVSWALARVLRQLTAPQIRECLSPLATRQVAQCFALTTPAAEDPLASWDAAFLQLASGQQRRQILRRQLYDPFGLRLPLRSGDRPPEAAIAAMVCDPQCQHAWLAMAPARRWRTLRRHLRVVTGRGWAETAAADELTEAPLALLAAFGPATWVHLPRAVWRTLLTLPDKEWRRYWIGARAQIAGLRASCDPVAQHTASITDCIQQDPAIGTHAHGP